MNTLSANETGLSRQEAMKRLGEFGPNELREERKRSAIRLLLEQFKNLLVVILLIATAISLAVGEDYDAIVIIVIVIAVAVLGFFQEYRAEKALEALKKMTAPTALVLRDGKKIKTETREIVPGDILLLYSGDRVSADARLIEVVNLETDESSLTGESTPVSKGVQPLAEETPVSERVNTVFAGTTVVYGRGKALVTSTGMKTEFGKIARMVQVTEKEETPLERKWQTLGNGLGFYPLAFVPL